MTLRMIWRHPGLLSKLGWLNLGRVLIYRLRLKFLHWTFPACAEVSGKDYFRTECSKDASGLGSPYHWKYFGYVQPDHEIPRWDENFMTGLAIPDSMRPWWAIGDFDSGAGDIKAVWEASRFDWVIAFAQAFRLGDMAAAERLNACLADWNAHNPPFIGPNWKCGQEASFRVIRLATAAIITGQDTRPSVELLDMVAMHMHRIASTISYAIGQDNNHGTSEAAALFIGGSWLSANDRSGEKWEHLGRKWLENRVARLISSDGTFSQYSSVYHRLCLDTLSVSEIWRRRLSLQEFSEEFYRKARVATEFLYQITNEDSGDVPNFGANDGTRLLPLDDSDARDFRPSVQLASILFLGRAAWGERGYPNRACRWLDIQPPATFGLAKRSRVYDDGGVALLRAGDALVMFRYPRFRFRPSQADSLNLDLWVGRANCLRDAGTFSYNADPVLIQYFSGVEGHNTVQFDGRDQMPRVGRFLFGSWLETESIESLQEEQGEVIFGAGYRDDLGAKHFRRIHLSRNHLRIDDTVEGFVRSAVSRLRLMPGDWRIDGGFIVNGTHAIHVMAEMEITRMELVSGWESRYYLHKAAVPVLEIEVMKPGRIVTEYRWTT